ncbi:MAG: metallophosphoesterase [Myxococcota bacterium]|nr:metallophosphoesterase [Myxococcota bacterium]
MAYAPAMARIFLLAILLVTLSESLIVHWTGLAFRGGGFNWAAGSLLVFAIGALNMALFPVARSRIHAKGLSLVLSRVWILGSVAALLTGMMLATVYALLYSGGWIFAAEDARDIGILWLGGFVVTLGLGSGLWGATVGNHRVRVDSLSFPLANFPSELTDIKLVHITDLHIGPLLRSDRLARFVERINELEAELIVITGDIFDFSPDYIEVGCHELAKLEAKTGVYAVLGNHDHYTGTEKVAEGIAKFTSIRLLRDEWEEIDVAGGSLVMVGLEDPQTINWMERRSESPVLERLAREIPPDHPSVLLAHRPSFFQQAEQLGFPLVLSGHTHGGQVALPFATNHNASRMISDQTRGIYKQGQSTLYVNRGLGMAGLPLRLNCPREIALIRLTA